MEIEVGYLPKKYYDKIPDAGGFFPFAYEGDVQYVLSLGRFYLPNCDENFLPLWMEMIKAFPLYFCAEIPSYWKEDFENTCRKFNISYKYLMDKYEHSVLVTEVQNEKQFREIFPIYITLGSGNDLVLWSANKDVFSVEQRQWKGNLAGGIADTVIIRIEATSNIFWIGYDGNNIAVISNSPIFSTYEDIIRTFPKFITPKLCEYE